MYLLMCLMVSSILPAAYYCGNICPPGNANNIHDVISPPGTVQEGIWYRVFCPEFRAGEALDGLVWYKGSIEDSAVYLIGIYEERPTIWSNRHEFSTDYSLVIKGVESIDEGSYLCYVLPTNTKTRLAKVDLGVIGTSFPPMGIPTSTNRDNFQRGVGRHTLQCQCTPRAPDAGIPLVYWSTGEGVSNDTEIIGARFAVPDGGVLQIQYGASYGIGSEFSLEINSLVGVHDEQRFWCHVHQSDGTRSSCYTDVTIKGDQPPDSKLRASKSSFYLLDGKPAIIPCTCWEPGDPACDAQWFKVNNNSDRHLLTYNLSTNDLGIESGFDLTGSLSLLIRTVDESSAGRYRCAIDRGRIVGEATDVLVIGNKFPLDGGKVTASKKLNLKQNANVTLKCPVRLNDTTTEMTIFWSFGAPDEQQSTTVIGSLVLPDGIRTMSDLGNNSCYGISYEGSVVLTNCSQDNDVRYWCHVFFKKGDVLHRSYVDVTVDVPSGIAVNVVVAVVSVLATLMTVGALFCAIKLRRATQTQQAGIQHVDVTASEPPPQVALISRKTETTRNQPYQDIPPDTGQEYEHRITADALHQYEGRITEEDLGSTGAEDGGDLPSWVERWQIPWRDLEVYDRVLGTGEFGEVRLGAVKVDGEMKKSAVKMLKGHASPTERDDFLAELQTMTSIGSHPHIVSLIGACQHQDVLYVALEYLSNGDLRGFLRTARTQSDTDEGALSRQQLLTFALDVAKGMEYLAAKGVIHRDLAARNILLGDGLVAKVSDFGLSRGEDLYVQTSNKRVPIRWLAIESIAFQTYTTQSDVWSFGILLWEITTIGGTPYPSIKSEALESKLSRGYRMPKPNNCDDKTYALMRRCWKEDPKKRPTFDELVSILSEMTATRIKHTYMSTCRVQYENLSAIRPELDDN